MNGKRKKFDTGPTRGAAAPQAQMPVPGSPGSTIPEQQEIAEMPVPSMTAPASSNQMPRPGFGSTTSAAAMPEPSEASSPGAMPVPSFGSGRSASASSQFPG